MNPTSASGTGTLIASWIERDDDRVRDVLASLDAEQLRAVLVDSLTLLDDFVQQLADHHAVSTRAVLRSMGIDPGLTSPQ